MACGQTSRLGRIQGRDNSHIATAQASWIKQGKKTDKNPIMRPLQVLRFKPLASRALEDQVSVIWSLQLFFLWHIGVLEAGPVRLGLYWKNKVLCFYRRHTPRSPVDAGMKANTELCTKESCPGIHNIKAARVEGKSQ